MNVTFAWFGEDIASSRLRAAIPQQELKKLGIHQGKDILVYGKHLLSFEQIKGFGKYVFDICDNHFHTNELERYYRNHAEHADVLTCNSEVMRQVIKSETGRDSIVIPEPYESIEQPPFIGDYVYWFGHISNMSDMERIRPHFDPHKFLILTNPQWTMDRHRKIMKQPLIVVIPTGKSMAKSENRMVESIRCGKYVCAEYLPAYEPFEQFFPFWNIPDHVEWVLSNQDYALEKVRSAQDYIRDRYAPATIAKQWLEVLNGID